MSRYTVDDLEVGMKVKLKTKEQLLQEGWESRGSFLFNEKLDDDIPPMMVKYLGSVVSIRSVRPEIFTIEGEEDCYYFYHEVIDSIVEDEEAKEDEYVPYHAVVEEVEYCSTGAILWDKDRIQRTFEDLEMYDKGYKDGFQRATELMKKEFGVEL